MKGKIIFISPHPDDVEFYCGGTLVKLVEQGCEVQVHAFSHCRESIPEGFPQNVLRSEFLRAMATAGVTRYDLYDFPVRRFNEHRQDILEKLVWLSNLVRPDFVFIPSENDIHQDHQVMHNEARRAFKSASIISYEVPLNSLKTEFNFIVPLESHHVEKKLDVIACYESQRHRYYSKREYIESILRYKGAYIDREFAETFNIIKWID